MPASALIFATSEASTGCPLSAATICRMLISAGAAAARMESSVDSQAVEHAVQNMARDSATTRTFFLNRAFLINGSPFDFGIDLPMSGQQRGPVAEFLQLRLDEQQLPLNAFHRGLIAVSHGLQRRDGHIAQVGLRGMSLLPLMILEVLLFALAGQLLRCSKCQDAIDQEADEGNRGRTIVAPESGRDLR